MGVLSEILGFLSCLKEKLEQIDGETSAIVIRSGQIKPGLVSLK